MPRQLRIIVYSVILVLSLYMYWLSGQRPPPADAPPPQSTVLNDPLRPSASLALTRESLTTIYARRPFSLDFAFVPLSDGRSRMVGRSTDGSTLLEVIGPPEAITIVSLMAALPSDQPLVRLKNLNAISLLFDVVLSDWTNRRTWVDANIDRAFSGRSVTTQTNGRTITMSVTPQTQTLVVNIAGPPL